MPKLLSLSFLCNLSNEGEFPHPSSEGTKENYFLVLHSVALMLGNRATTSLSTSCQKLTKKRMMTRKVYKCIHSNKMIHDSHVHRKWNEILKMKISLFKWKKHTHTQSLTKTWAGQTRPSFVFTVSDLCSNKDQREEPMSRMNTMGITVTFSSKFSQYDLHCKCWNCVWK